MLIIAVVINAKANFCLTRYDNSIIIVADKSYIIVRIWIYPKLAAIIRRTVGEQRVPVIWLKRMQ